MSDRQPNPVEELTAENAALRADVARLQASVASLQSTVIHRDTEIARLRRPPVPPRVLDPKASDRFRRPAHMR